MYAVPFWMGGRGRAQHKQTNKTITISQILTILFPHHKSSPWKTDENCKTDKRSVIPVQRNMIKGPECSFTIFTNNMIIWNILITGRNLDTIILICTYLKKDKKYLYWILTNHTHSAKVLLINGLASFCPLSLIIFWSCNFSSAC